jgi:hypothetical protein
VNRSLDYGLYDLNLELSPETYYSSRYNTFVFIDLRQFNYYELLDFALRLAHAALLFSDCFFLYSSV